MKFKNNKKQKWIKPKLTILIKSLPEENVLGPCVTGQTCHSPSGNPASRPGGS